MSIPLYKDGRGRQPSSKETYSARIIQEQIDLWSIRVDLARKAAPVPIQFKTVSYYENMLAAWIAVRLTQTHLSRDDTHG